MKPITLLVAATFAASAAAASLGSARASDQSKCDDCFEYERTNNAQSLEMSYLPPSAQTTTLSLRIKAAS